MREQQKRLPLDAEATRGAEGAGGREGGEAGGGGAERRRRGRRRSRGGGRAARGAPGTGMGARVGVRRE